MFGAIPLLFAAVASQASAGERVVFCEKSSQSCPASKRVLGKSARGIWVLVDDGDLHRSVAPGSFPRIVYFSLADYEEAITGLTPTERESALQKRLDLVSNGIPTHALELIHDDLLRLAGAVRDRANNELDVVLDAAVILSGGAGRFSEVLPSAAVAEIRTSLARIVVEFDRGGTTAGGYQQEHALLAAIDAELSGRPRPAPFASPERAYFVPHVAAGPRSDPSFVDQPSYGWRGGSVQSLRPAEISVSPWKDHKPRLLYHVRQTFLKDITSLTPPQIDRRLRARLAAVPASELTTWIATLAFKHSVSVRQYNDAIRRARVAWLARWDQVVTLDSRNLVHALADAQPNAPSQRKARIDSLRADLALATAMVRGAVGATTVLGWLAQVTTTVARLPD